MRSFVIIVCLIISWAEAQNSRGHQHDHSGWDIRLAVPGDPGNDYPTLGAIPRTSFSCAGREPGYYADLETNCQVFKVCTVGSTYGFQSFLCPNGTLFNQAVFVCDWWMNVNCQDSQQLSNNNNEQFENLRLGPQLMKDIKKMLTHPMRNPYDKTTMRNNLIVMQDYKPPSGQLFPNGALLAGPERAPNNVYIPAKQIQQTYGQNPYTTTENEFPASTPETRYVPAAFSTEKPTLQRDIEVFQRQQQRGQYIQSTQNLQSPNLISNGHARQFKQNSNTANFNNGNSQLQSPNQNYDQGDLQQYTQRQTSKVNFQTTNSQNAINSQRGHLRQHIQYSDNKQPSQLNSGKQADVGVIFAKQQNNYDSNQDMQPYTYRPPPPQFSNSITDDIGNEFKQNLVSTIEAAQSTIVTKTVPFNRIIQEPKPGKPKSRITVKTWIVNPSKSARLIAEPTSYVYNRPTLAPTENIVINTTPYKPTAVIQRERITEPELRPYVYNRPTVASRQTITTSSEPTSSYPTPTPNPRPTFSSRLNLKPTLATPVKASRVYLAPTTFKPAARLYLPPSENSVSRQYLSPSIMEQPVYYQNSPLISPSTTPVTTSLSRNENKNGPLFTLTKHSRINANHNNKTFADILTKEKLDITVNDIVKDTDTILQTASPERFEQYRQYVNSVDSPAQNSSPTEAEIESGENLTSQTPTVVTKNARLIAQPSMMLEPPVNSYNTLNKNQLSNLPYFKDPAPTNTIERTVSLKISIPEKLAAYIFNNQNESDFDSLEILNTGSSNYLVLTNPILNKSTKTSFIPLGRLVGNKNKNISNSQALVYSFLADSINVAKEYSNTIQQESLPTTPAPQFKNLNDEELARITNNISQLTSSQYSGTEKNNNNAPNTMSTTQTNSSAQDNQYRGNAKYSTQPQNDIQQIQLPQYIKAPSQATQNQDLATQFQNNGFVSNVLANSNQNKIYSGQLYQVPVPDVTSQIYNRQSSANFIQPSNLQHSTQTANLLRLNQNNNVANNNNLVKQSGGQVEIVQSQTLPLYPAKLQLEPPNEPESFNSQETFTNFLNSDNGISAQLQDKIVGTIPHPLEENKLLTYKKDQSYYLFTKFENNDAEQNDRANNNQRNNFSGQQSAKIIQSNVPNLIAFQLIPSVSYQLEDEREQEKLLNAFQIDEFGAPRNLVNSNLKADPRQDNVLTTNIDYTIEHPTSANRVDGRFNNINALYAGPSSYSAPQSSVGNLEARQMVAQNFNSRLEQFNENQNAGYTKMVPARQFTF